MKKEERDGLKKNAYCWRNIGIWSETAATCPRLEEVIHCRNCPEFTAQGRALFDMEASSEYLQEWQDFLSEERTEATRSLESVIAFRLDNEWFAFRTAALKEVTEATGIHRIPQKQEESLLGLANIKGELHLCFSLHKLLGLETGPDENSLKRKFIILEKDGQSWVFPVDEISGISKYNLKDVGNIPATVSKSDTNYIKEMFRVDDRIMAYLDDELIIYALRRRIS